MSPLKHVNFISAFFTRTFERLYIKLLNYYFISNAEGQK
jgi:hypothetical protein